MRRTNGPKGKVATSKVLRHWREAVPDDRLAHLIKDTWRGLLRAFQVRLAEHAVSIGHWPFLRILWERDGLTLSQLSDEAGVMVPTTFAAVNAMERLGYVSRGRQSDSLRKVYISLTPRGRALRERLVPIAEELNRIAVRGIPPRHVTLMRKTLLLVLENLVADEIDLQRMQRRVPSTRDLANVIAKTGRRWTGTHSRGRMALVGRRRRHAKRQQKTGKGNV